MKDSRMMEYLVEKRLIEMELARGECRPSDLAEIYGWNLSLVNRILEELETDGVVEKVVSEALANGVKKEA